MSDPVNLLSHRKRGITGGGEPHVGPRQQEKEMMVSIGQNTTAAEKLTALLERMEHLLDEIDGLKDDLKDLKAQARDEGFNVAAVVRLVAMRRNKQLASQENATISCCTHMRPARRSTSPSATARPPPTQRRPHRWARLRRQQNRLVIQVMTSLPKDPHN
jgi:uncharacterized protein (UPF0335 family)